MKYYCEYCLDLDTLNELNDEGVCPECENDTPIDEEQVKAWVKRRLTFFRGLSKRLGISDDVPCGRCDHFNNDIRKGCDLGNHPTVDCPDLAV